MQEPNSCYGKIFKLVPRWDKCINVSRHYVENKIILQWYKSATFNSVKTTHLIFISWGILLSEHSL